MNLSKKIIERINVVIHILQIFSLLKYGLENSTIWIFNFTRKLTRKIIKCFTGKVWNKDIGMFFEDKT